MQREGAGTMNRNLILSGWLVLGLMSFGFQTLAAPRKALYQVKQMPVIEENCHLQAKSLAARFSELTGVSAVGRCEAIQPEGYDISIVYEVKAGLELLTTKADLDFPSRGHVFLSKENCQSQTESEAKFFKEITGIEPLVSFCRSQETYYGLKKWALIIEGFGSSRLSPQWAGSRFAGKPSPSLITKIESEVKTHFTQLGTPVRIASLQEDEHGALRLNLMYYGKYGEQLVSNVLASLESPEQCSEMLSDFVAVNTLNAQKKALGYCINNPYDRSVDLVGIVNILAWYSSRLSVEDFSSYNQCQTEKAALIKFYNESAGYKVVGGFCTQWGPNWKVYLLEEPSREKS